MSGTPSARLVPARSPRRALAASAALAAALLLGACGSSGGGGDLGGSVIKDGQGCTITEAKARPDDVPTVEAGTKVGKDVGTDDLIAADKDACKADATKYLTLDLVGATAADGKVFTSTWADGHPITAQLGQGLLIAGLETGLDGMAVGARRQITIPAAQAYGADGNPDQGIGKDADLVFVVDLLSLTDAPRYCNPAVIPPGVRDGKPTDLTLPAEPVTDKVKKTVLTPGDGPEVTSKSYLTVEYVGVSCATGRQFDSSWDRTDPITVALADATPTPQASQVIPGWTEGLVGQKQGALVQLDIPADQAYGEQGSPPAIGRNDPITFAVQILEVSDQAPDATTSTTVPAGG